MKQRSQLEIIEVFLKFCNNEQIAQRIITCVNLSTNSFQTYKEKLITLKLLETREHDYHIHYKTTVDGRSFLKILLRDKK